MARTDRPASGPARRGAWIPRRRRRPEPSVAVTAPVQPPGRPEAPVPPSLPPGRIVDVPDRGEMFVREAPGPAGGPVVLLLHGWTASADLNWFPLYGPLAEVAHVIAVDHRGHGRGMRSDEPFTLEAAADDAAALLRHLGHQRVVAVGYSMGGPIAMLLWRRHSDLVDGLILEATALEWRGSLYERLTWKLLAGAELAFRLGPSRGLVERYLRQAIEVSPEISQWQAWVKGELRRGDPAAMAQAGQALSRYDARPFAGDVDVPTAVVVTTKDRLVRPSKQRRLAEAVPRSQTFTVDAGHDAPLLRPLELASATTDSLSWVLRRLGQPQAAAAAEMASSPS